MSEEIRLLLVASAIFLGASGLAYVVARWRLWPVLLFLFAVVVWLYWLRQSVDGWGAIGYGIVMATVGLPACIGAALGGLFGFLFRRRAS